MQHPILNFFFDWAWDTMFLLVGFIVGIYCRIKEEDEWHSRDAKKGKGGK